MWSECGSNTIHAYRDRVKLIGYLPGISVIPQSTDFTNYDFTSRALDIPVGEVVIWLNQHGHFAATLVTEINVKSRGASKNLLSFKYKIYVLDKNNYSLLQYY